MQCHALFKHITSFANVQGFAESRNRQKNESNMLERTEWRNKRNTDSQNVINNCDVTKGNRKSQSNSILLQQLLNNGISLHKA